MRVSSLALRNYRNFSRLGVDLSSRVTIFVGRNGRGKTNILESVYLLSQGKSFRGVKPIDLLPWNLRPRCKDVELSVHGTVEAIEGRKSLSYRVIGGRRKILVNDKPLTKAALFYGQLLVVEFIPDDLQVVKGGPKLRRQFLDRTLAMIDPLYVESLVYYERALKSRNAIIRQERNSNSSDLRNRLKSWEQSLAEYGQLISNKRKSFVEHLLPRFITKYSSLCEKSSSCERANLLYEGSFIADGGVLSHEDILKKFDNNFYADISRGITSVGVQRDDIDIQLDCGSGYVTARQSASQGQTRSLVLALKLAALDLLYEETGRRPVLLLDDIESELDGRRKEALFDLITQSESQVLVTLTEYNTDTYKGISQAQVLRVENGIILPE